MKKFGLIGIILLILTSCTADTQEKNVENPPVSFAYYTITSTSTNSTYPIYQDVIRGNLQNNKLFSTTGESFYIGISQGPAITTQQYFYTGNLLTKIELSDNDVKNLFYDNTNNLIGITWNKNGNYLYYKAVHISNTVVYLEKITLPYNNLSTQIIKRSIEEFDANNNVIKAGFDYNLDGIMDATNQYTYTNNNITSVLTANGTLQTYIYSTTVNNFSVLQENSYGKKVRGIFNSECFASPISNFKGLSTNLETQDLSDATYVTLPNNYFKTRTVITNTEPWQNTNIIEFFFN